MTSKSSSPGPNATATTPAKQTRSRKAATLKQEAESTVGRAGSAGGIVLEKQKEANPKATPPNTATTTAKPVTADTTEATLSKPRRKPRKLNKDPAAPNTSTPADNTANEVAAAAELEALKSRVRGLEAKVEELYKSGPTERTNRSPRRRGKGRKGSSTQQVPTLATTKNTAKPQDEPAVADEDDEDVEELTRLESELEVARQDLAHYRPRNRRSKSGQTNQVHDDDDVEEINRDGEERPSSTRQVTLSGSYRIPLPASVNTEDLKTIQSGVSAAQNVARGFLEQRRAAAALREQQQATQQNAGSSSMKGASTRGTATKQRPQARTMSSSMEIVQADEPGAKQSWGEWIGGYSMAISRAVQNIEHEAAVESQRVPAAGSANAAGKKASGAGRKTTTGGGGGGGGSSKRPTPRAKMSSEQAEGLMS